MAINGINDSAREHDQYQRRLRELGDRYSEDTNKQRARYENNVTELDKSKSKSISELRQEKEQSLTKQKEDQMRETTRLADRFEKQSHLDSKNYYDKFGRQTEENFHALQHEKSKSAEQVEELVKGNEKYNENRDRSHDEELTNLKRQQANESFRNYNQTNDKLDKSSGGFQAQMRESTKNFNQKLNSERRQSFEESRRDKMLSDLRLEQFQNQHANQEKNMKDSFALREQQLTDEKNLNERKLSQTGADSLETYRNRLSDNLARTQSENNFAVAKKDIETSNKLSAMNHEHKLREQDQKLSMERTLNDAKYTNEARENKQALDADMAKRRGVQNDHLARESMKKTYEDTISELNSEHSRNLRGLEQKDQEQFDNIKGNFQNRITKLESSNLQADDTRREKLAEEHRNTSANHLAERHRIAAAYEQKQKALEGTTKRTNEELGSYYQSERLRDHREREVQVAEGNQDNVAKMNRRRMRLETINDIQGKEYKSAVTTLEDQHRLRSSTMTKTNAATLEDMQKMQEIQFKEFQRESENMQAKIRADHESSMKNMAFDYEYRIRNMAQNYEQKLAEQEMTNSRETNSIKLENERVLRALAQRHRTELESVQDSSKKALALQETQYKDRMKLQDDNQKVEVSKLRHSNELLRMKS